MEMSSLKKSFIMDFLPLLVGILFIFLLLTDPVNSSKLVMSGLTIWCNRMIPALFPFMVLSGFLLRSSLSHRLSKILYPLLGTMFRLSPDCIYVIMMGFLCGFPMGANIVAESLSLKKISRREGELLLSFCNNIGPVYFISFVSMLCPYYPLPLTLSAMYLIPLFYGLLLRYTCYRDIPIYKKERHKEKINSSYGSALQDSLQKAIVSILLLGGYMVIFTVLQLPFYNLYYQFPENSIPIIKGILEISAGITALHPYPELYGIVYDLFLPFGGLCCLYQTYAMIKDTPLSLSVYLTHKLAQTFITMFVYGIITFII